MPNMNFETVLDVHHWNDTLFSFKTTRKPTLKFRNGEFIMIGLETEDRPVMRAYSIASANYEEHLEFLSIKVDNGKLTSKLKNLTPGDKVIVSKKPTGTLVADDLKPGKRLYLFATGTGLAPFLSIIQDLDIYERFEQVILCHGVRYCSELAYRDWIENELPQHEFLGEIIQKQLTYYPTVTREPFKNQGRLTHLIESNELFSNLGVPELNPETDRAMICGSPDMLRDIADLLQQRDLQVSPKMGIPGDYVIERAFVE